MELSGVGQGLARKLSDAGFNSIKSIASADPNNILNLQLNLKHSRQIVSSAKLLLLEKVETLKEQADGLNTIKLSE